MFTNRAKDGCNNRCGRIVAQRRKQMEKSQRQLADMLQIAGLDIDKNAVQRIEAGSRFVTDVEIVFLAEVLNVSADKLLGLS